jgi:hypothetical protein
MSKDQIISELPKLRPDELAEIQARLWNSSAQFTLD